VEAKASSHQRRCVALADAEMSSVGMQLGFTCSLNYSEAIASERKEGGGTALSCTLSSPDIFMDLSLPLLSSV
jgi:hypothetical protein